MNKLQQIEKEIIVARDFSSSAHIAFIKADTRRRIAVAGAKSHADRDGSSDVKDFEDIAESTWKIMIAANALVETLEQIKAKELVKLGQ